MTECSRQRLLFQAHGGREVTAAFDGGGLLLRRAKSGSAIVRSFVGCFTDHRDSEAIEFSVSELLLQRVMGLALGYEDLNDHDDLSRDPLLPCSPGARISPGTTAAIPRIPRTGKSRWLARARLTGWN